MPPEKSAVISCLRYRDVAKALDWLCRVFGFAKKAAYKDDKGAIMHAELTLGGGLLMIGPLRNDTEWSRLMKQPDEIGGFETQAVYLVVEDADAVFARAQAAGATIIMPIKDEDHGGRGFGCRDLEQRLWYVGEYDPWQYPAEDGC